MYRWLEYDEAQTLPSACELYEKAVTLGGVSKSLGLPGLRIGWLASRDPDLLRGASEIKDYTTICSSAPSEILALIGLRAREWLIGRNVSIVGARNISATGGRSTNGCPRWPGRWLSRAGSVATRKRGPTRWCASAG
jgi:aspartate/methionine/tyrosine aminotransferase